MPIAGLAAGVPAEGIGLGAALLIFGGLYLAVCLAPFLGKVWRGLDAAPAPALAAERV